MAISTRNLLLSPNFFFGLFILRSRDIVVIHTADLVYLNSVFACANNDAINHYICHPVALFRENNLLKLIQILCIPGKAVGGLH